MWHGKNVGISILRLKYKRWGLWKSVRIWKCWNFQKVLSNIDKYFTDYSIDNSHVYSHNSQTDQDLLTLDGCIHTCSYSHHWCITEFWNYFCEKNLSLYYVYFLFTNNVKKLITEFLYFLNTMSYTLNVFHVYRECRNCCFDKLCKSPWLRITLILQKLKLLQKKRNVYIL